MATAASVITMTRCRDHVRSAEAAVTRYCSFAQAANVTSDTLAAVRTNATIAHTSLMRSSRSPYLNGWSTDRSSGHSRPAIVPAATRRPCRTCGTRCASREFDMGDEWPHVELVGHDARPARQLAPELGDQLQIELRQQEDRDDGGFADVGLEQILVQKLHAVADPPLDHVVPRHPQVERVDLDADTAGAEQLRGRNRNPAVP